nr:MAG TPA: hypothetical protein [Caudoviricetes sp.]
MKFKNIIVGVIEETENELTIEQFLKNPDMYEVIEDTVEEVTEPKNKK